MGVTTSNLNFACLGIFSGVAFSRSGPLRKSVKKKILFLILFRRSCAPDRVKRGEQGPIFYLACLKFLRGLEIYANMHVGKKSGLQKICFFLHSFAWIIFFRPSYNGATNISKKNYHLALQNNFLP